LGYNLRCGYYHLLMRYLVDCYLHHYVSYLAVLKAVCYLAVLKVADESMVCYSGRYDLMAVLKAASLGE
jgi:hypothetical protein